MSDSRVVIEFPDSKKVWINPQHIIKMEKSADGRYFIYVTNGEIYEISHRVASSLESYFEDL